MIRWQLGIKIEEAFKISLQGAACYDYLMRVNYAKLNADKLLRGINELDNKSVINACKLVGYDVCYRKGMNFYKPVEDINPNQCTINNIIIMIKRTLKILDIYGPITKKGFDFDGGYTDIITKGDGDYLTEDTLWDLKVLKGEPTSKDTLQLLVYYIMGFHSKHQEFKNIKKLGMYNPRKNKAYIINISDISKETVDRVSKEVIGYK